MKLIKKGTLFHRSEIELTEEEYKAYKLGHFYGVLDGFVFGVILTMIIAMIISV